MLPLSVMCHSNGDICIIAVFSIQFQNHSSRGIKRVKVSRGEEGGKGGISGEKK